MSGWDWAFLVTGGVIGVAGLLLCAWALFRDRSRGRRRCPQCWYDMSAVPGMKCPECGQEARHERRFLRTRRRWRRALLAVPLLALGAGTALVPQVKSGAWVRYPPVWSIHLVLRSFDADAKAEYEKRWLGIGGSPAGVGPMMGAVPGVRVSGFRLRSPAKPAANTTQWQRLLAARHCTILLREACDTTSQDAPWPAAAAALDVLPALGREARLALPVLMRLAQSKDPVIRHSAALSIVVLGEHGGSTAALARLLRRGGSAAVRETAAVLLNELGSTGRSAAPAVRKAVTDDKSPDVRAAAARAIASIDAECEETLPVLGKAMEDADAEVRVAAVEGLLWLAVGNNSGPVAWDEWMDVGFFDGLPPGAHRWGDRGIADRVEGPPGLQRCENAAAARAICLAVEDVDPRVRTRCAQALAQIGHTEAVPALRGRWSRETDPGVRLKLAQAMWEHWPGPGVLPYLTELLETTETQEAAEWAVWRLSTLGSQAVSAAPVLAQATRRCSEPVGLRIVDMLIRFGPSSAPQMTALLAEGPVHVRREVATAVGSGHRDIPVSCEALRAALEDDDPIVRVWVIRAIGSACGDDGAACRRVHEILATDVDDMVRRECAKVVGGPVWGCADASAALESAMNDPNVLVRHAAASGLAALSERGRAEESGGGLERALRDEDEAVRKIAEKALGREK